MEALLYQGPGWIIMSHINWEIWLFIHVFIEIWLYKQTTTPAENLTCNWLWFLHNDHLVSNFLCGQFGTFWWSGAGMAPGHQKLLDWQINMVVWCTSIRDFTILVTCIKYSFAHHFFYMVCVIIIFYIILCSCICIFNILSWTNVQFVIEVLRGIREIISWL